METDRQLEAWLRAEGPPLPDHGFSERVLAALPAPGEGARRRRMILCLSGALAGLLLAGFEGLGGASGTAAGQAGAEALATLGTLLSEPAVWLAAGTTVGSLLLASWRPRGEVRRF